MRCHSGLSRGPRQAPSGKRRCSQGRPVLVSGRKLRGDAVARDSALRCRRGRARPIRHSPPPPPTRGQGRVRPRQDGASWGCSRQRLASTTIGRRSELGRQSGRAYAARDASRIAADVNRDAQCLDLRRAGFPHRRTERPSHPGPSASAEQLIEPGHRVNGRGAGHWVSLSSATVAPTVFAGDAHHAAMSPASLSLIDRAARWRGPIRGAWLGDHQRGLAGDRTCTERPLGRVERRNGHRAVVDERRLESDRPSCGLVSVRTSRGRAGHRGGEALRNDEVNRD